MKIVVLAGGTSTERDISIVTSVNVCKALRKLGHEANVIDVFFGSDNYAYSSEFFAEENDLDVLKEKLHELSAKVSDEIKLRKQSKGQFFGDNVLEICKDADIVFMGLHGENGENGKIQAAFDLLGIKYTGTGFVSSAISMDKELTKRTVMPDGVPMPDGVSLNRDDAEGNEKKELPLPCVVKPACGGSSVGVTICRTEEERDAAISEAFRLEPKVLVEELVKGREFSIGVIDGKAVPIVEIIPRDGVYDYKNKYDPDGAQEICPAELPEDLAEKMQMWAEKACGSVGIGTYARVDEMVDEKGNIFCLEINTLPGMTPTSLLPKEASAMGLSYEELVQKLIDVSLAHCEVDRF
ncbi:MAG: D-alanine--D-alanine ligase [Clostridiales bacterium]|nr:D-alanine--D-alanine ligase [Clostridiales bacterium]MBS5878052.1 D-alanine--D-alanine ligase [Clostridiales bacterium]MDU3490789.1 D-alanine--D-alanine ligase [Clostridiales bacterium]